MREIFRLGKFIKTRETFCRENILSHKETQRGCFIIIFIHDAIDSVKAKEEVV